MAEKKESSVPAKNVRAKKEASQGAEKTVIKSLGLSGGMFGAAPCAVDVKDGRTYRCEVTYPKGHPRNPMTDAEIVDKFRSMAVKVMDEKQVTKVVRTVFELERLEDIQTLNKLMVFR